MRVTNFELFDGTVTADGNTKAVATAIKTVFRKSGIFFIKAASVSGTDPTLDVDIITYDKITNDWYVIGSFKQFTATGKLRMYIPATDEELAIQYAITGTDTPTFTWKVSTILN